VKRTSPGQEALDFGEAFAPPRPKPKTVADAWARHCEDGLCQHGPYGFGRSDDWCKRRAIGRPALGADQVVGCEGEVEDGFVGMGDPMCGEHAGDVAEGWWWELWQPPEPGYSRYFPGPFWFVDSSANEWLNPSVWVQLEETTSL
jgi:hypothetical protein